MGRADQETKRVVEVRVWPGLSICAALELVLFAEELPGIGDDFAELRPRMPSPVVDDIVQFLLTGMPSVCTDLSLEAAVTDLEPEAFLSWVDGLDAAELAARSKMHARKAVEKRELHSKGVLDEDNPDVWVQRVATHDQRATCERLLADPQALKLTVTRALRRFWDTCYRDLYESHGAAMAHVTDRLPAHPSVEDIPGLFAHMLGRSIGNARDWERFTRVHLIPLPFMGPYLMSMTLDDADETLLLAFDAERAAAFLEPSSSGPEVSKLKALADETRLKILGLVQSGERFGGDIVQHLGISQPGVSRHLRLLVASGLLQVRQEGTSKYYALCDDELEHIAEAIRKMRTT